MLVIGMLLSGFCVLTIGTGAAATISNNQVITADDQSVNVIVSARAASRVQNDTDGDGLSDQRERELGTDPENPDTDGDRLTDGREITVYGTDPLAADSDADGIPDAQELHLGTDPTNADTDGDGLLDGRERSLGTSPRLADSDKDGLSDQIEVKLGTNALTFNRDSGVTDKPVGGIETFSTSIERVLPGVGGLIGFGILIAGCWFIWRWYQRYTSPVIVKTE